VLCALAASAVRGVTGFADGLTFQALWALLTAFGALPQSCGAIRKGVLFSTLMQLVTLPIQAWATRHHLGVIRGYLMAMTSLGSATVYVGAWLLLQSFALQLRIFAGVFFCVVSAAQLSNNALKFLGARSKAAVAAAGAASAPAAPAAGAAAAAESALAGSVDSASIEDWAGVANPAPALAAAAQPAVVAAAPFAARAGGGSELGGEGIAKKLVFVSSPAPTEEAAGGEEGDSPPVVAGGDARTRCLQWFESPAGLLWFPRISPVLSPVPLLLSLSFASLCAGVLNGMLGAGGPPLMLTYSFLALDKDILRGFGVVPSVFMVLRLVLYVSQPNGVWDVNNEWLLYCAIGVAAAGGSVLGGRLRAFLDAPAMLQIILALVWLSGWSMLGAFSQALPAGLFSASTLLWVVLFAGAARWPLEFDAVRQRLKGLFGR